MSASFTTSSAVFAPAPAPTGFTTIVGPSGTTTIPLIASTEAPKQTVVIANFDTNNSTPPVQTGLITTGIVIGIITVMLLVWVKFYMKRRRAAASHRGHQLEEGFRISPIEKINHTSHNSEVSTCRITTQGESTNPGAPSPFPPPGLEIAPSSSHSIPQPQRKDRYFDSKVVVLTVGDSDAARDPPLRHGEVTDQHAQAGGQSAQNETTPSDQTRFLPTDLSGEMIQRITEAVAGQLAAQQARPAYHDERPPSYSSSPPLSPR